MKNMTNLETLINDGNHAASYRAERDSLAANVSEMETAKNDSNDSPRATVDLLVERIGYAAAVKTVASLVNRSAWDGRISSQNAEWAKNQPDSWDEDSMVKMGVYTRVHMAHLDQIADYMRKYEVPTEPATEEPTEAEEETEPTAAEIVADVTAKVEQSKTRSAWTRGVKAYALELCANLAESAESGYLEAWELSNWRLFERSMLNGADSWQQFSEGGCSLVWDGDIAARLCNATELKRTDYGAKDPNPRESWIDVQSRALRQACNLVLDAAFPLPANSWRYGC